MDSGPEDAVRFVVVDQGSRIPAGPRPLAVLVRDKWNDFGFETMFHLVLVEGSEQRDVGVVKIARTGMGGRGEFKVPIPDEFAVLGEEFFSVGQDDTYYEKLAQAGEGIRRGVLVGLRDMAFDEGAFATADREEVTRTSLWRFVRPHLIGEQFRRIARGGVRLSAFTVAYQAPAPDGDGRGGLRLTFDVRPDARPSSNIHVLTGRNGAGKSVLLNRLARAVAEPTTDPAGVGHIIEVGRGGRRSFANLVSVSFSAFDDLPFLPENEALPTIHVGLRTSSGGTRTPRLKSRSQLKRDFADSVEACLTGERELRWLTALDTLNYAGSGLLDESWLADFRSTRSAGRRRTKARRLFAGLSSGHKVVLLTVTRLVEHVGERTLVLIDEPETHLHPPLLAAFVRVLSELFTDRNGLAVIATHSPVVLQEVPSVCVWKLRRYGSRVVADRPSIETFGENVGVLTHEIFGLEVTHTGFHRDLNRLVDAGHTYESILEVFGGRLGGEARVIARSLVAERDFGETVDRPGERF